MNTLLNETITQLKLSLIDSKPRLDDVLTKLKASEANYYRTKVISLSAAIIENPNNNNQQADLTLSLNQLDRLLTA